MEQLRNAWQGVLALFKKKKRQQEEPAPEETAQKQNDASVKDKSLQFFGINKKIVIGTSAVFGGVFLVALISSFFFSPDGKDANKKELSESMLYLLLIYYLYCLIWKYLQRGYLVLRLKIVSIAL